MKSRALVAAVLVVLASTAPAVAAAAGVTQSGSAYAGSYVQFETKSNAVVDYSVNGTTAVESIAVQSTQKAKSSGGISAGVDLDAVTSFQAAGLSVAATSSTQATVKTESGAKMRANDNARGILVIDAGGKSQYVRANLSASTTAEQSGENRVVITKDDGTKGAFLVVGQGKVTVNEAGNVTAKLQEDAKLVYRQYNNGRSESEKNQESLITSGQATAEVYYQQAKDSGDSGKQFTANVVKYGESTTIQVTEKSKSKLTMTVQRSKSEGKVVITSISDQAFKSTENIQVMVDGEAAAEVESYSAVKAAAEGGDKSAYLVRSSATASAKATTDVVIGINHFSKRKVTMTSGDSGDGTPKDKEATNGGGPGFGAVGALAALLTGAAALVRRH